MYVCMGFVSALRVLRLCPFFFFFFFLIKIRCCCFRIMTIEIWYWYGVEVNLCTT
ncbi:hypothetical protein P175DRAFT_05481 [Aspergillus ochraceoroseus IBT 24754]|uniref:Uncharacterized protein n=1 Tax=Aspergillus ochraceoroseus IBT 24754 TaxID=1392256 RepID=A0A2T5M5G6_9EURO|nr:uncharacterized protein P175DRAFT_05481 [Aspergillus ochraceoroseus IBT 24754]PTU23788.1 hypothetical protein P175DRAFT_05481 [Aspergillus ochraceoroseus IBT 24754]